MRSLRLYRLGYQFTQVPGAKPPCSARWIRKSPPVTRDSADKLNLTAFKHPSDDPVLKKFELALTGVKTEDLLSVRFDRTSGEQYAYVSAFAAEGVGAARSSAAHKCASRLAFRVVSALNDDPAVTKSMIFNTRLRTLIVSSCRMLAHRDV